MGRWGGGAGSLHLIWANRNCFQVCPSLALSLLISISKMKRGENHFGQRTGSHCNRGRKGVILSLTWYTKWISQHENQVKTQLFLVWRLNFSWGPIRLAQVSSTFLQDSPPLTPCAFPHSLTQPHKCDICSLTTGLSSVLFFNHLLIILQNWIQISLSRDSFCSTHS